MPGPTRLLETPTPIPTEQYLAGLWRRLADTIARHASRITDAELDAIERDLDALEERLTSTVTYAGTDELAALALATRIVEVCQTVETAGSAA